VLIRDFLQAVTYLFVSVQFIIFSLLAFVTISVNAEPYGSWPSKCYVSNDPAFPDDNNTKKLTDEVG